MKKIILSLLCGLMLIPVVTGCGKKEEVVEEKPQFEVFDSKVNYVIIKDKKIYFAKNYIDLFKQFEGLGCYVRKDGDISVDDIIKNNEIAKYREQQIVCYTNEEKDYFTGAVRISYIINTMKTDFTEIFYIGFSGDNFDVVTDKGTVLFGDNGRKTSKIDDAIKAFGDKYDVEENDYSSFVDYTFKDEKYKYELDYIPEDEMMGNFYFSVDLFKNQ